ncbi:hypothetical protein [Staphylococcus equorum]|uniref:hypothetical protein n=1 Tax=Staphylococcus equorum TaxID=246432 RepID=UPI0020CE6146|nr:hypothetical protein [Staphylococcus equorum]UTT55158.1 hypothetical protein NMQ06_08445 [Staphylococcus equorum]UTT55219.1 hypothetical protein NMQ06_08760 [Staphylococcus equorum]
MTELDKAYKAYEAKFDEEPPLMFLRGMSLDEQAAAINERVKDGKSFGEHANEEGYFS